MGVWVGESSKYLARIRPGRMGWDGAMSGMGQRVTEQVSGSPDSGYGGCGRVDVRKGKGKTDLT